MTLQIRSLLVRVRTDKGPYGRRLDFGSGLCVVHGANASGKSTLMQSMIYALGLEGMFGPAREPPFSHAMTDWLFCGSDESASARVTGSEVLLELSNQKGDTITLQRAVKGVVSHNLVRIAPGGVISNRVASPQWAEYYVRERDAYTSGRGFHRRLTEFIGWELPNVATHSGESKPLYLECLFPLLYIEQKHAWSYISGRFPTYLGIKDAGRRAVEFLLGLDVLTLSKQRASLAEDLESVRRRWHDTLADMRGRAAAFDVQVEGIPTSPQVKWTVHDNFKAFRRRGNAWISVAEELEIIADELSAIAAQETPTVAASSTEVQTALNGAEFKLKATEDAANSVLRRLSVEQATLQSITARLAALAEDHEQYIDYRKLQRMGSDFDLATARNTCPTCSQHIAETLVVNIDRGVHLMNVEESLNNIKAQQQLFESLKRASELKVSEANQHLEELRSAAVEIRVQIRSLKRTLVSDDRSPSEATIARRLQLERARDGLQALNEYFDTALGRMERITNDFAHAMAQWTALPKSGLSDADKQKLELFERTFIDHAVAYGIKSLNPRDLRISSENYRPSYQNYDLQFDLSASDAIRATWAYMVGLLETAASRHTNHPGFLVLDEPRQQSAEVESLRTLLRHLGPAATRGQQVIVATSEDLVELRSSLTGLPHQIQMLGNRGLARLESEFG